MKMKENYSFIGFSKDTISFLTNLEINNNKKWFETHKQDYEKFLLNPLKDLVNDLAFTMKTIDPYIEVSPLINKTISRIYRDTRFSNNKSPFKTTMWITFKRPNKEWKDAPAYFFELSANYYRYGMGFYRATPNTMKKFRERIDKNPNEFKKVVSFFAKQNTFVLEGEKYKKVFDKSKSTELQEWYQRKNFYLVCNEKQNKNFYSNKLTIEVMKGYNLLSDFYKYLVEFKQ